MIAYCTAEAGGLSQASFLALGTDPRHTKLNRALRSVPSAALVLARAVAIYDPRRVRLGDAHIRLICLSRAEQWSCLGHHGPHPSPCPRYSQLCPLIVEQRLRPRSWSSLSILRHGAWRFPPLRRSCLSLCSYPSSHLRGFKA